MSRNEYFTWFLTIFEKNGFLSTNKSYKTFIHKYILFPTWCVLLSFATYNYRYLHHNIFDFAELCISLTAHTHVLVRHFVLLQHSSVMESLLKNSYKFWPHNIFGEAFANKLKKQSSYYIWLFKGLRGSVSVVLLCFFLKPLFVKDTELPQASWIPGGKQYCKIVIYILQVLCFSEFMLLLLLFDGPFLFTCSELENQFILLKMYIQRINLGTRCTAEHEENCLEKLRSSINYHRFLLEVHEKLKTFSSLFLFLQYLISILGICVEILVIRKSEVFQEIFVSIFSLIGLVLQCCGTFLVASNAEIEAETLPETIYSIDWYNASSLKFGKHVVFMIMKCQQPLRLSGAGMFDVDRNRLLQIMRASFTISTILLQVRF